MKNQRNEAKKDYENLEKKLKELFPGIQTTLAEGTYKDYWYVRFDFQKKVTFTHPTWTGGQPVSCEIETLYVIHNY